MVSGCRTIRVWVTRQSTGRKHELLGRKEGETNQSKKVTAEANVEGRKRYLKKQWQTQETKVEGVLNQQRKEPACPLPVWCLQNEGAVLRTDYNRHSCFYSPRRIQPAPAPHGAKTWDNKLLTACQLVQLIGWVPTMCPMLCKLLGHLLIQQALAQGFLRKGTVPDAGAICRQARYLRSEEEGSSNVKSTFP